MLIRNAEVGGAPRDVRIRGARVDRIAPHLAAEADEAILQAGGDALLPGLHDHHIHLLSMAAALRSVACGPPDVCDAAQLGAALRAAPGTGWIRGVGYHDSVAGPLDRVALDAWVGDRPARIQHRSGRLWILSSAACAELGVAGDGRWFHSDAELRRRLGASDPPDLGEVGNALARRGIVGVTDATAGNGPEELAILAASQACGALPQRLRAMGGRALPEAVGVDRGERKLVLHEAAPPDFEALCGSIREAHGEDRGAAFHCVTVAELHLALSALEAAGRHRCDRIEHASLAPPEAVKRLAEAGIPVATNHGFLHARGDAYLHEVDPLERPWLYRGRGFLDAGVPLAGGSDAPFGPADPWRAMQAAVDRRSAGGQVLGGEEALTPEEALALFSGCPDAPGGPGRRVEAGAAADLCLLDRPWSRARGALASVEIVATLRDGVEIYSRSNPSKRT